MKYEKNANVEKPVLTIGDLCEALADGRLAASRNEDYYTLRRQDLRRWVQQAEIIEIQPAPSIPTGIMAAS